MRRHQAIRLDDGLDHAPSGGEEPASARAGGGSSNGGASSPLPSKYAEALATLGVEDGAPKDVMDRAWKEHLKRNHPDLGGSTRIVQEINGAWDTIRHHNNWI